MNNTKPLSKKEYPSSLSWNPVELLLALVNKEEHFFKTVSETEGKAGEPIYKGTEVTF